MRSILITSPSLALNKNAPTCIVCRITYKFVVLSIIIVNQLYYCDRLYGLMKIAVQKEIKETETEATRP